MGKLSKFNSVTNQTYFLVIISFIVGIITTAIWVSSENKWKSFGLQVFEIDGHNHNELLDAFNSPNENLPKVIIAHTVKGKGVSFMEDSLDWHYKSPDDEQLNLALKELE